MSNENENIVTTTEEEKAPEKKTTRKKEKMVSVRLFKDNDKYKSDVFVAVNGRAYQIKRGVRVEIPDYVAEVLDQSLDQDEKTARLIEEKKDEYKASEQQLL